ncbi:hypothetical protein M9458_054838, partial [Cirrhinus mrigala]
MAHCCWPRPVCRVAAGRAPCGCTVTLNWLPVRASVRRAFRLKLESRMRGGSQSVRCCWPQTQ